MQGVCLAAASYDHLFMYLSDSKNLFRIKQEENLLYCLKRICCICNSLYTFIIIFLLLKNKRIERGRNIIISLCMPSDSAAASFIFFPREEAFSVPLTSKDRSEVSIKIRAMNHYGSRLLQGSNCVLAESFEVRAAWYLYTSCWVTTTYFNISFAKIHERCTAKNALLTGL